VDGIRAILGVLGQMMLGLSVVIAKLWSIKYFTLVQVCMPVCLALKKGMALSSFLQPGGI